MSEFTPNCTVIDDTPIPTYIRGELGDIIPPLFHIAIRFCSEDVQYRYGLEQGKSYTVVAVPMTSIIPDSNVQYIIHTKWINGKPHKESLPISGFTWAVQDE